MEGTFTVTRTFLRRVLITAGLSENNISLIISQMEKGHKHMNAISFGTLLEKGGLGKEMVGKILRRIGMDDVAINTVINTMDEERINAEAGEVYNITLDIS